MNFYDGLWIIEELEKEGKRVLLLIWDNASRHISKVVRNWLTQHNRATKEKGGVRIIRCQLPSQSPWLNPIEPHWRHGKRAICEPNGELTAEMIESKSVRLLQIRTAAETIQQ
ncbi:MAG: transposase [Pyrinomonadaceae bacterium]